MTATCKMMILMMINFLKYMYDSNHLQIKETK